MYVVGGFVRVFVCVCGMGNKHPMADAECGLAGKYVL